MKYFQIQDTDLNISAITLGTWVFSGDCWGQVKTSECIDAVAAAIDCGINLIDTAPIYGYGAAEQIIGKAIRGKRDKVLIATKCGLIGKGASIKHNLAPDSIRDEIEESLRRLQIDCIDIYQCHWPDPKIPIEKTLEALCKLQREGKIRHIGVSNFDAQLLKRAAETTKIVTLQNQYSLLEKSIENKVLPMCRELNVGVLTYGPLAGGILSGKYEREPDFKGADARSFFYKCYSGEKFRKVQDALDILKGIGKPLNQVAINWVRQQPGVASVITGCRNPKQVKQNALAIDWDLNEDELKKINEIILNL